MKQIKKVILGSFCCILFMTGCSTGKTDTRKDKPSADIRVMTFNAKQKEGIDPKKQGEWVRNFQPDIVALQEVDKNTKRSNYDVAGLFREGGDFKYAFFSKQMPFQGGEYGMALFANQEVIERKTITMYSDESMGDEGLKEEQKNLLNALDPENTQTSANFDAFVNKVKAMGKQAICPSIVQKIVIKKDEKTISIYGVHFSYETVLIRDKQREQLVDIVNDDTSEYQVILGNINNDQGTYELNYFAENFNLANGADGLWQDTYPIGYDTSMKSYSIDNIITSKNIKIENVTYEKTDMSDHTAIYADLILK